MDEVGGLTLKVIEQLAKALSQYTPEYITECHKAKAEGLKLTEPLQKKYDNALATIASVNQKQKELGEATAKHETAKAEAEKAQVQLVSRETVVSRREEEISKIIQTISERETLMKNEAKRLGDYKTQLDGIAQSHQAKEISLKAWEDSLGAQEANFEEASKLIKRK